MWCAIRKDEKKQKRLEKLQKVSPEKVQSNQGPPKGATS